jgi:hypothetical protein
VKDMGAKKQKIIIPAILFSIIIVALGLALGSADMQSSGPVSTENQAVEIALPLVQEYIQSPNQHKDYSIAATKVTFEESDRPYWLVEIEFKVERDECYCPPAKGYEVVVWADNGEIHHHGPTYATGYN